MKIHPETARQLIARIESGDNQAESELAQSYTRGVRLLLFKRIGDFQLAKDLCQDTMEVVIRRLRAGELNKPGSLSAFIRQTAVNLSIQHFRKEKRYVSQDDGIIELKLTHRDRKASQIDNSAIQDLLHEALKQLAVARDREILNRYYLRDEDKAQICCALNLSDAHFDRVLYRAKQRMRELIDRQSELRTILLGGLIDG